MSTTVKKYRVSFEVEVYALGSSAAVKLGSKHVQGVIEGHLKLPEVVWEMAESEHVTGHLTGAPHTCFEPPDGWRCLTTVEEVID